MSGLKSGRSISAVRPRLLPILLPSRWTTPVPGGQLWNVGPAHRRQQTVLNDLPMPTDLMVVPVEAPREANRCRHGDMHGMILDDAEGRHAVRPGSGRVGRRTAERS